MKFYKLIIILFYSLLIVVSGCDIVEPPYMNEVQEADEDTVVVKKFFLEEFTGHLCPNCPEGKAVANELKTIYGDRLVVMSIHTGVFARTQPGDFENDYRADAGAEIAAEFGVVQYPSGMINRTSVGGNVLISPSAWGSAISQLDDEPPTLRIRILPNLNQDNTLLNVSLNVDVLIGLTGNYNIAAFLVEDGLISPQKTNNPDYPDGIIMDYEHNNVLRAPIAGAWGEPLCTESTLPVNETYAKNYTISIDPQWSYENCKVVAFIYNVENGEVIQAEIRPISQ